MRTIDITVKVTEYDSPSELPAHEQELLTAAKAATKNAYAPYSKFNVGAALLLENGITVSGNNQENMAYPSGLCAERVAIFSASATYPGVPVKSIAIYCQSDEFATDTLSPCGGCRQVLAEYEMRFGSDIRLIMMGEHGKVQAVGSVRDLLPLVFKLEALKRR